MKQNDIKDKNILKLDPQHIENLFNVYTNEDGQYYYNLLKTVYFPNELDPTIYVEYETKPKDTWPLIAWTFYGDVRLWWIVCAINNIMNPVGQPDVGTKLKILGSDTVRSILVQIKEQ